MTPKATSEGWKQDKSKKHKMMETDNPQSFLDMFRAIAEACKWPESKWAVRQLPLLSQETQAVVLSLSPALWGSFNSTVSVRPSVPFPRPPTPSFPWIRDGGRGSAHCAHQLSWRCYMKVAAAEAGGRGTVAPRAGDHGAVHWRAPSEDFKLGRLPADSKPECSCNIAAKSHHSVSGDSTGAVPASNREPANLSTEEEAIHSSWDSSFVCRVATGAPIN